MVSDSEYSIITELKSLASSFKPKSDDKTECMAADENLNDAGERVKSAKKINHIDDILARLRG